jgi:hypothetical protein
VIRAAYASARDLADGCCPQDSFSLGDGTPLAYALPADYAQSEGRVEMSRSFFSRHYVCVTLPTTIDGIVMVADGRCSA